MDTPQTIEDLRGVLAKMTRSEVQALAAEAQLSAPTVEKFRLGHIRDPHASKVDALRAALTARAAAVPSKGNKARSKERV